MPNERKTPYIMIGRTGLNRAGGLIYEEQLRQLSGTRGVKSYMEMRDNDAIIGAVLFAVEMLIRKVKWTVKPTGESKEEKAAAEYVEECRVDMSHTWEDLMAEILSMLWAGWSYFEIVYKRRLGPGEDPTKRSRYTDGKTGWRKIELRAQESLDHWEFDEDGGILGMWQRPAPTYELLFIPIEKALLFRTKSIKGSPEGRSLLRNAYRSWYIKKRAEENEAIGIERDMVGTPKLEVPVEVMLADADSALQTLRAELEKMGSELKRDEREFIMIPAEKIAGPDGTEIPSGYKIELLKSGGQRQIDTDKVIKRYESRIAMTVLGQFLLLGQDKVGSFALASEATNLFAVAISAILDSIAAVFNRYAIPRLFEVNRWKLEQLPELVPGDLEKPQLEALGKFIESMVKVGAIIPGPATERKLRQLAELPDPEEDEEEDSDRRRSPAIQPPQPMPVKPPQTKPDEEDAPGGEEE